MQAGSQPLLQHILSTYTPHPSSPHHVSLAVPKLGIGRKLHLDLFMFSKIEQIGVELLADGIAVMQSELGWRCHIVII